MSLPFNTDTSVQLPLTFNTSNSYAPIITSNNLPTYSGWTTTGNNIYNTALAGGRVSIGTTNQNSILELSDGTQKVKFGSRTSAGNLGLNHIITNVWFRFISTDANLIAYFGYITNYDLPTQAERVMILEITRTALNMTGDIYASGNIGFGVAPSLTYKCKLMVL